ncbi:hypothetical protein CROQUDRAFT_657351, partial [Cronartium quercuum f. sp. fusiforme G11]
MSRVKLVHENLDHGEAEMTDYRGFYWSQLCMNLEHQAGHDLTKCWPALNPPENDQGTLQYLVANKDHQL